jgi:drug/metabolite transporter (DMT)-like permease
MLIRQVRQCADETEDAHAGQIGYDTQAADRGIRLNAVAYIITCLLMGSNWYATRVSLDGYKPFTAAALRFAIAGAIFILLWKKAQAGGAAGKPTPKEAKWLFVAGVLNAVQYGLFYISLLTISGGLAAVIYGTVQLFNALLAAVFRVEKVTWVQVAGAPLSLVGLALIYWDKLGGAQATGVVLMVISVIVSAISTVILKHQGRKVHPVFTTMAFLTMSALGLGLAAFAFERNSFAIPAEATPTIAIIYQGIIGTAFAFGVYFFLLRRISVITAASIAFVLPVVALTIDWIAQEPLDLSTTSYIGVALTLAGVVLGFVILKLRTPPAPAAAPAK